MGSQVFYATVLRKWGFGLIFSWKSPLAKLALVLLYLFIFISFGFGQIESTSSGGDWALRSTWVGNMPPTVNDDVIIKGGVGIGNPFPQTKECQNLRIDSAASLSVGRRQTLAVSGSFENKGSYSGGANCNGYGTLTVGNNLINEGSFFTGITYVTGNVVNRDTMLRRQRVQCADGTYRSTFISINGDVENYGHWEVRGTEVKGNIDNPGTWDPALTQLKGNTTQTISGTFNGAFELHSDVIGTTYQWFKNNQTLVGETGRILLLDSVRKAEAGLYYCQTDIGNSRNIILNITGGCLPFITTWKTDNPGVSNSTSITIPTYSGETYDFDVDWNNDGVFDSLGIVGDITHDFGAPGTYTIRIQGKFPRIYLNDTGDSEKLVAIEQWGNIAWSSMELAFAGSTNMVYNATDSPDLSGVTDMSYMFSAASSFDGNINNWDVSNVTNMAHMFFYATSFKGNISNWNVSNVSDFRNTFAFASSFNGDISNWNVGSAIYMTGMFGNTDSFNGNISNWDVSSVSHMGGMFNRAIAFNGELGGWDVRNVTGMGGMFSNATSFNQNLGNWILHPNNVMGNMLNSSGLNTLNYDSTLLGWESQMISNRNLGAVGMTYCNGKTARNSLINTYGWTINGDALEVGCIPLPVEIEFFELELIQNNQVKLNWQTASELNNSGFDIEKSVDGLTWNTLAFEKGAGNSSDFHQYEYVDSRPLKGLNYYRLKQLDFDNNFEYSQIISIYLSENAHFEIYPNPTNGKIEFIGISEGSMIIIKDSSGRKLREMKLLRTSLDISNLPSGVYSIRVVSGEKIAFKRIIKQ